MSHAPATRSSISSRPSLFPRPRARALARDMVRGLLLQGGQELLRGVRGLLGLHGGLDPARLALQADELVEGGAKGNVAACRNLCDPGGNLPHRRGSLGLGPRRCLRGGRLHLRIGQLPRLAQVQLLVLRWVVHGGVGGGLGRGLGGPLSTHLGHGPVVRRDGLLLGVEESEVDELGARAHKGLGLPLPRVVPGHPLHAAWALGKALALPPHGGDEIVKGDLLEHWHELIVLVQAKVCLGGESLDLDPGHVVRRRGVLLKLVPSKVDLLALGRDPDVGLPPSTPPVLRHAAVTARGAVARLLLPFRLEVFPQGRVPLLLVLVIMRPYRLLQLLILNDRLRSLRLRVRRGRHARALTLSKTLALPTHRIQSSQRRRRGRSFVGRSCGARAAAPEGKRWWSG
mmetsp:Transcript_10565/g.32321  ORF Transcript_10565/g.32321 Transcript_10565/m.32321 type:complete len:400 (-) Transcript_10565:91-1290(-)